MSEFYIQLEGKSEKEKKEIIDQLNKVIEDINTKSKQYIDSYHSSLQLYSKKSKD